MVSEDFSVLYESYGPLLWSLSTIHPPTHAVVSSQVYTGDTYEREQEGAVVRAICEQ